MKFTCKIERNFLHFIGLTIMHSVLSNNRFCYSTSVYRKPTSTSLYMKFNSFTPLSCRLSVFKCLIYRALRLCLSWNLIHDEIQILRSMLLRNAFPSWILDRIIKSLLNSSINPLVKFGPAKERLFLRLPYLGKQTDVVRRKIMHICKQFIPYKDVIIYFKPGCRVANYFRTKDVTPIDLRSRIVYQNTCASCQASYVGQTSRHLLHRVAEHRSVSHLTDKEVKNKVYSNIREHCYHCPGSDCSLQNSK